MAVNAAELAFMSWLADEERQRQKDVHLARRYHDGDQDTYLTSRLAAFLNVNSDHDFNLNVCRTVVGAVEERLVLDGIQTTEPETVTALAEWAEMVWDANELDVKASYVHEGALRDGEYFVMVDWANGGTGGRPRMTPHQRYVASELGGDGFGCKAHYPEDDTNQPMEYASKRWIERLEGGKARNRMNLYYPDRVEKYQLIGGSWIEYMDDGDTTWPLAWVDGAGQPLGIPVIHFRNTPDLRPEAWDAIPLQRAINKGVIDLMAAADMTAFQIYVAFGFQPTSDGQPLAADGSNAAKLAPAMILGTTKSKSEADMKALTGSDLRPLIESIQSTIGWLAVITSTPESRLSFSRQIAAEGTLQEQNEGLFAKVRKRRVMFDGAWRDCFEMARKLDNLFGSAGLSEEYQMVMAWEPVQARDTQDEREEWRVKRELGVPLEQLWAEMGYDADQIEAMKASAEYQARIGLMQVGLDANGG